MSVILSSALSPDRPPADPDLVEHTFVDPAGQVQFLQRYYLESYVPEGGSKLKLIIGREGAGKTHLLRRLTDLASRSGYLAAVVSARNVSFYSFDSIYREIMAAADILQLVRTYAQRVATDLGYSAFSVAQGRTFIEWALAQNRDAQAIRKEVKEKLEHDLYLDRDLDRSFAIALLTMTAAELGVATIEPEARRTLESWVTGLRVPARDRNRLELRKAIDRYTARFMLRSFLHFLPKVGLRGVVFAIDDLDEVVVGRTQAVLPYTRGKRDELFEGLRQVVDEVEALPRFLMLLAGRRTLWEDERRGIPSYEALLLRLQNEVHSEKVNLFNDLIDLDHLWQQHGRGALEEIAEAILEVCPSSPDLRARVLADVGRIEFAGTVSPVRRAVAVTLSLLRSEQP